MKINFDASYRELERIINASAQAESVHSGDKSGFDKLLSSISPEVQSKKITTENNSQNIKIGQGAKPEQFNIEEMHASLKLPEPELLLQPQEPIDAEISTPSESVKSLSILEMRRVRSSQQISKLRAEERKEVIQPLIETAGKEQGVDPLLGVSIASVESGFNPTALSRDGHNSKGIFQLLDSTGLDMRNRLNIQDSYNPFDAEQNVKLGVAYIRYLHDIFSTNTPLAGGLETVPAENSASLEKIAVAAFNAGEGRVAAAQRRATLAGYNPADYSQIEAYLPNNTQEYVKKVIAGKTKFKGGFIG